MSEMLIMSIMSQQNIHRYGDVNRCCKGQSRVTTNNVELKV